MKKAVSAPRLPPISVRTPSNSENTAPDTKMNTAASSAQKKRSLPCPKGWSSSGGRSPSCSETSRNTWFMVSAREWAASASIAVEPPISPAASLAAAIDRLAANATQMVRRLSDAIGLAGVLALAGPPAGRRAGGAADQHAADQARHGPRPRPGGAGRHQRGGRQHHQEGGVVEALHRRPPPAGAQAQAAGHPDGEA